MASWTDLCVRHDVPQQEPHLRGRAVAPLSVPNLWQESFETSHLVMCARTAAGVGSPTWLCCCGFRSLRVRRLARAGALRPSNSLYPARLVLAVAAGRHGSTLRLPRLRCGPAHHCGRVWWSSHARAAMWSPLLQTVARTVTAPSQPHSLLASPCKKQFLRPLEHFQGAPIVLAPALRIISQ